jgi:hypothetical protein
MKHAIGLGMIGLGLLLLVLSGLWTTLFPGTSSWTPAKGERWSEVKDRLHNLSFVVNAPPGRVSMHRGPDLGEAKQEYDQLRQENDHLRAEFESAYHGPRTAAKVLKWSGISLAVLGLIGWYAANNMSG